MNWKIWLLAAIEHDQAAEDLNRQAMQEEFRGQWAAARDTQRQADGHRRAADATRRAAGSIAALEDQED